MNNTKLFADLAELAGGAVGVLSSIKQQLRDETRERMDDFASRMDLVTRADIDRLEGMMAKLRARLDALEQKQGARVVKTPAPKKPANKSSRKATKKTKK